ncbi:MAG: carbohydrate kinase [Maribacter sp.]|nr:MAG: carbohydrate kinase [Maribacter sp.]
MFLGIDLGSSSVKVALVDAASGKKLALVNEPENEMAITALRTNWAEQDPKMWWEYICKGIKRVIVEAQIDASKIKGIGISYQMHGLVVVDKDMEPLRNSIIWCDSRAIGIGDKAFDELGHDKCSEHLLNSPGNFTASKLKWVLDNEPGIYKKIHKYMLPGDFVAAKFTGTICTTKNSLSEGVLWDYKEDRLADWLLDYYGIDASLTPDIVGNFTNQGGVSEQASKETGLPVCCPVIYRAGDQPNNALSLNILDHGEVAATGGTSGVVYAVTNKLKSKESSRINNFAHVNYSKERTNVGKLLCINGCGIMYRWLKNNTGINSYGEMNSKASGVPVGSDGLVVVPFGNGAERMLNNKNVGAHFLNLNLNQHNNGHLCRAALEGIAFSFVYGMEILRNDNAELKVIRAGNDNLFRAGIFANTVATLIGYDIEIYNTTGAIGAARACSLTDCDFGRFGANIMNNDYVMTYKPLADKEPYLEAYNTWKTELERILKNE